MYKQTCYVFPIFIYIFCDVRTCILHVALGAAYDDEAWHLRLLSCAYDAFMYTFNDPV